VAVTGVTDSTCNTFETMLAVSDYVPVSQKNQLERRWIRFERFRSRLNVFLISGHIADGGVRRRIARKIALELSPSRPSVGARDHVRDYWASNPGVLKTTFCSPGGDQLRRPFASKQMQCGAVP